MVVRSLPNPDSELYHHGIKGQRWGIRHYQNADGSLTEAGKNRYAKKERRDKVKNRRNLSEDELRRRISRLKLEKEYKQLSDEDLYPGKKFCGKFLEQYGSKVLVTVASGATLLAINYAITKKIDPDKAAKFIAKEPGKDGKSMKPDDAVNMVVKAVKNNEIDPSDVINKLSNINKKK